jgi:hypothetical protein
LIDWQKPQHFDALAVYNNCVRARIKSEYTRAGLSRLQPMLRHPSIRIAILSCLLAANAAAQSVSPDSAATLGPAKQSLFDRVIARQKQNEQALEIYERIERVETRKHSNDPTPPMVKLFRVIPSGTGMDRIPVGPDGRPADPAAYRHELEKLEKALALAAEEGRAQHEALDKYAKKKKDRNDLIDATRNAFLFKFIAREPRGDRMLSKYTMEPNPAFKPTTRFTAIYTKVHGFVWIDEDFEQLARIEGEVTDDISVGLFLGKIYKGSHFMQERYEFFPGLWLASFTQYDFDGRKIFSAFSIHERTFYSNYRYIGPPNEALATIRKELADGDLGKSGSTAAEP